MEHFSAIVRGATEGDGTAVARVVLSSTWRWWEASWKTIEVAFAAAGLPPILDVTPTIPNAGNAAGDTVRSNEIQAWLEQAAGMTPMDGFGGGCYLFSHLIENLAVVRSREDYNHRRR